MSTSTPATTANPPRKRVARPRKKQLTPKQKLVKESAQQRFKIEKLVFVWQEKLFSQAKISAHTLQRAATYLQPKTYEEIVEERVVQDWCGYPLCDNSPKAQELQKYKISLSQRKVYDQTELANYCSDGCYHKSKYYILQLSEEPVWFRDFNIVPTTHIITLEEDFKTAIRQEKKKTQISKTSQEIRQEYVQHLLGCVPKDAKAKFEIVEKSTVPPCPPSAADAQAGVYDSIEGYRIEIKKNGKSPTTMVLKKKKEQDIKQEQERLQKEQEKEQEQEQDHEDPDALFETMMMLKDMNLDKLEHTDSNVQASLPETKEHVPVKVEASLKKNPAIQETPMKQPMNATSSSSKSTIEDTNVIKVATKKPKKPKKKKGPELSLFGTIWTMLDHMTTKATRVYLNELQNNNHRVDVSGLLKEDNLMDEAIYLRGQIFSERILDTYAILRTQLDIRENLEDDIVNVIKTFRLSDASMVALNPAQCYMMALVLIKSLADILLVDTEWKYQFEDCCKTVDQSTDMVDACVRVLKVASV